MVLSAVDVLAVHVDRGDAEIACFFRRREDATAPVLGPVELDVRSPAFGEALSR